MRAEFGLFALCNAIEHTRYTAYKTQTPFSLKALSEPVYQRSESRISLFHLLHYQPKHGRRDWKF